MPNVTSRTSKIVKLKTVPSRKSEKSARPSEPSRAHEDWLIARLKNPKEAAAYIEAAIEENNQGVLMLALRQVAMARGGVANTEGQCRIISRQHNSTLTFSYSDVRLSDLVN